MEKKRKYFICEEELKVALETSIANKTRIVTQLLTELKTRTNDPIMVFFPRSDVNEIVQALAGIIQKRKEELEDLEYPKSYK
jgi:hypothetical protein